MFSIFVYSPESKESLGGQRLIKKADIHIGDKFIIIHIKEGIYIM